MKSTPGVIQGRKTEGSRKLDSQLPQSLIRWGILFSREGGIDVIGQKFGTKVC